MLDMVSANITKRKFDHPTLVAIDGMVAAGKTRIAKELIFPLQRSKRQIISVSLDDFQNPVQIRYRRGRDSAEGYYYDAYNYETFLEAVVNPLQPEGDRRIRRTLISFNASLEVQPEYITVAEDAIILCEGVFLMRPELFDFWDLRIFVDITLETALQRAVEREILEVGSYEKVRQIYEKRFFAGQRIYFDRCRPLQRVDMIIDNNDFRNPVVIEQRTVA